MYNQLKIIIPLILFPVLLFAQKPNTLSGWVKDKNKSPLSGAQIDLLNADSSSSNTTYTDKNGFYKLSLTATAKVVQAKMQGYETEFEACTTNSQIDFILFEVSSKTLSAVTVNGKKQIVEYKADRTIFNVENSISASGTDAMEAIKKAPGVLVVHNEITLAGKSSVSVMINGRLQQLSGDDLNQLLRSIPSDNISKIEIITSPSSKYDAEGNAGVINLVLKKNTDDGFKGNVSTSYTRNSYDFGGLSTALNYKSNKLNLFCNANLGRQAYQYTAWVNTYFNDQSREQNVNSGNFNYYSRIQIGGDYQLNKKSILGFAFNEAFTFLKNDEHIHLSSFDLGKNLDSTTITNGKTNDKYPGKHTANINYELKIDSTGKKLNIDLDYFRQKGDRTRDFNIENYLTGTKLSNAQSNRITGQPLTEIMSAKADMEIPLKQMKINLGAKISDSYHVLDNLYETKISEDYKADSTKSNQFNYHEEIEAAYVNANKSIKKFEFQFGVRIEHTRGVGVSNTLAKTNILDYTKLFPSGFIRYAQSQNHSFSFSMSRRINRPGYGLLNPFRFYFTPNAYSEGNPYLQPSFNYLFEAAYTFKSKLNFKLIHNRNSNYFDRVFVIDTINNTSNTLRKNIGNTRYLGFNISGSLNITKWWELSGDINGGYSKFMPYDDKQSTLYSGVNYWTELSNTFYLNKKRTCSAELSGYYYTPRQKDYKRWDEMSALNLGLRYMLFNKNLIISLNVSDLFAKTYWLQTNLLNVTKEYSYDDERSIRISFNYKFGNKNIRTKQIKSIEEIQRANN
ncbi:MAG: outer membrane beta-barrel protein [Bacteroidota bacterium]